MLSEASHVGARRTLAVAMRDCASLAGSCLRALLAGALALTGSAQVAGAAPASFSPLPLPTACTEPVQPALLKEKSSSSPVRLLGLAGSVYTAELAGTYDRGQPAPRAALASRLIETSGEDVDFIVVFTSFEFSTGDALAFYNPIRNDVRGIGLPIFDHSALFGSPGRLQGYVDMAAVDRYSLNTQDPDYRTPLNILSHELMHRWGVSVRYRSEDGQIRTDLIGREGSHWSLLADTEASVMFGGRWQAEADGAFRLVEAMQRLSKWDLYLAGLAGVGEVPATRLLRNSGLDATELPVVGTRAGGTFESVSLQQVIAVEGEREPTVSGAQRHFTAALVLLVRPGESIDPVKLSQLQRFSQRYESYFQSITEGRASLRFINQAPATAEAGAPEPLRGSEPFLHQDPVGRALAWLRARQQTDGGFADRPATAIRDTSSVLRAVLQVEPSWPGADAARAFLQGKAANNQDDRIRLTAVDAVPTLEPASALLSGWADSPYDLSLTAALDADSGFLIDDIRQALLGQLQGLQGPGGGFSVVTNGAARLRASLLAARALLAFWPEGHASADAARAWLLNHLLELPLQGARSASSSELADALVLAGELRLPESLRLRLRAALQARQGSDGDWEGSVYTTAVAALALARLSQPDLELVTISSLPNAPRAGEPIALQSRIRNGGGVATPATAYRWLRERSDTPGAFEEVFVGTVPPLMPGEVARIEVQVETRAWPAISRLRLQLDPENALVELSEDNNQLEMSLQLSDPGTGIDPALVSGEHDFDPPRLRRLGDAIRLTGRLRNLGGGFAQGVLLRLDRVEPGQRTLLAERRLDVSPNSQVPYTLDFSIQSTGEPALQLTVDPLGESEDQRRENNVLELRLPVEAGVDLVMQPDSLELEPGTARVGSNLSVRIASRNLGSRHSGETHIELRHIGPGSTAVLQRRPLQVEAGATSTTEFVWRPDSEGLHRLQIALDPDARIDELDESNNLLEIEVDVVRSEGIDLLIAPGSSSIAPAQPLQGRPLRVDAQVSNQGAFVAGEYSIALYLGDPRSGGQRLAAQAGPPLSPGASASIRLDVDEFPARGDVSLFLMVDSELAVAELDEGNNFGVVDAIARAMADLGSTAQALTLQPEVPLPATPVILRAEVSNLGEQPSQIARARLFELRQGESHPVAEAIEIPALDPGARFEARWEWSIGQQGAEGLILQLDPDRLVPDGDRSNNEVQFPLVAEADGGYALTPFFSPNADGIRDRALVVLPTSAAALSRVDVLDAEGRAVARLADFEPLSNQRSLAAWDGLDFRGEVAPDGDYTFLAGDADGAPRASVRVVLDTNRPMALAAVQGNNSATRRLPSSVNEWQVPVSGSPAEDYLYTFGNRDNSALVLKRGIARTHAYMGGVEPVLSARWLERHAGNSDVDSLLIEPFSGRELLFTASGRLWAQDVEALDQPRLITALPVTAGPLHLMAWAGTRRAVLQDRRGGAFWVDLDSGSASVLPILGNERIQRVYAEGVLVGRVTNDEDELIPSRFLSFDPTRSPVELGLQFWDGIDCFARAEFSADQPVLFWHALRVEGESVTWIDLQTGASRQLFNGPRGGCPGNTPSRGTRGSSAALGFAQARLHWLEPLRQAMLVDHAAGQVRFLNSLGLTVADHPVPPPLRVGDYSGGQDNSIVQIRRGEAFTQSPQCPARLAPDWSRLSRWRQVDRSTFDPLSREVYFSSGEVVLDADPAEVGDEPGLTYGLVCEGAVDYFALSIETGELRRVASQSAWVLQSSEDRAQYPVVAASEGLPRLPAVWPRFFQRAGAHLRNDGRVSALGSIGPVWARAPQLLASIHDETRLLLSESAAGENPRASHVSTSFDRLRADLRASSNGRSVTLTGYATDANLDYFQVDYARVDAPEVWLSLMPLTRLQIRGDEFMTWAPPQAGAYVFRLRVVDRAGNRRDAHASAELAFSSPISNARTDHRAFSPNGDGVKDQLRLDFTVTRPTELQFVVVDAAGRTVFTDARTFGANALGEQQWVWNGQGASGVTVADGVYRVELSAGFAFPVAVDTVFPTIASASLTSAYPPGRAAALVSDAVDLRGSADITPELDLSLEFRSETTSAWRRHPSTYSDSIPGARLRWLELFGASYRWVAEDRAGNAVRRELAPVEPALALTGLDSEQLPADSSWQGHPFAAVRMSEVPEHRRPGAQDASRLLPHSGVWVHFRSGPDAPEAVQLEIARTAGHADPERAPLAWRALPPQSVDALGEGRFRIEADFSDLAANESVALRVRVPDASGSRVSNAMRFHTPPSATLTCTPELFGMHLKVVLPRAAVRARLRVRPSQTPSQEIVVEGIEHEPFDGRSMQWVFPGRSSYPGAALGVELWFEGSAEPWSPELEVIDCGGSDDGGEPSGELALSIGPSPGVGCGAPVSNRVHVWPGLGPSIRQFRLELVVPGESQPRLLAGGDASQLSATGYPLETIGLAGMEGVVRLHVVDRLGRNWSTEKTFPIDSSAPLAGFVAPASGTRVCAIDGGLTGIDAFVSTDSSALYALEVASLSSSTTRYTALACNGESRGGGCEVLDDAPSQGPVLLQQRSFSRRVLTLPDRRVPEGAVSFRLRALDWSGAQTCATTDVHVDASVEIAERREPLPGPHGSLPPTISSAGDPEARVVRWFFRAREAVQLRAEVFATTVTGSAASPRYEISGSPLRSLLAGQQPSGEFEVEWDARLQGQNAPDGVYGMRLQAQDDCGHARDLYYFVRVDTRAPELQLVSPTDQQELRLAAVQAVGTVRDDDPGVWELAFSTTGSQGPWQQLAEERGNVAVPRSLGVLQTAGLAGDVWLRLSARDRIGNASELVRRIRLLPRSSLLASARLTRTLISPNGDGRLDDLELRLLLSREALLDVELVDSVGRVVERLAQSQAVSEGPYSLPWGGQIDPATVPDGAYLLRARATDRQLGGEPDTAELGFVVDSQSPTLAWSPTLPAVLGCDSPPELAVDDVSLAEFQASLASETGASLREVSGLSAGSYSFGAFSGLSDGPYRLRAVALDGAGNRREEAAEFALDCTPPALSLDSPEPGSVLAAGQTPHRIQGSVVDSHPRAMRLELVAANDSQNRRILLDSPDQGGAEFDLQWVAQVPDGGYTLELSAEDQAGNTSTHLVPIEVDASPPVAVIHRPLQDEVMNSEFSLNVSATDARFAAWELLTASPAEAARDEWSRLLHGEQAVDAADLPALQGLPAGERLFRLVVRDRAGFTSRDERRLIVDSEPPPAPVELVASLEAGRNVRLTWQGGDATDLAGFHVYRLVGTELQRITEQPQPARQYLDLDVAEGLWAYQVTAMDRAGNESDPSNRVRLRVDRTPPDANITQPREGERVRGTLVVRGTAASAEDFERYELSAVDVASSTQRLLREGTVPVSAGALGQTNTRDFAEGATVRLRLRAWDRSGNLAEATRTIEIDNQPPAAPQGLQGDLSGADLALRWLPNTEPDLLGYLLYRNGSLLTAGGSLPADLRPLALAQNLYVDASVPDGEHTYRVYAIDMAGNLSAPSAPFTSQVEQGAPSAQLLRPEEGLVFDQPIEVLAQTEHRDVAEIAFFVRGEGQSTWAPLGAPLRSPPWRQVLDPAGRAFGDYELRAVATDRGGLVDPQPPVVRVRHDDITPPGAPRELRARADGNEVHLAWLAVPAPDLSEYRVERFDADAGWMEIATVPGSALGVTDSARPQGTHRYRVLASDRGGNRSQPSAEAQADVFAIELDPLSHTPSLPSSVSVLGTSPTLGQVQLWRRVDGTELELPGVQVGLNRSFAATASLLPGENLLSAAVTDLQGNRSIRSHVVMTHGLPAATPQGLTGSVTGDQVVVRWAGQAGDAGYRIYRNGQPVLVDPPLAQTVSAFSNGIPVPEVLDGDPETSWREQPATLSDRLGQSLELRWPVPVLVGGLEIRWSDAGQSARDFDVYGWYDARWNRLGEVRNQAGDSYRLVLDTAYPTTALRLVPLRSQWVGRAHAVDEVRVLVRGLLQSNEWSERVADGRHRYTVTAVSDLGFESPRSIEWIAEVGDTDAPPAVVLEASREGRDALLSWTASEAADIARYRLMRGSVRVADVEAGSERRFRDLNLPNGTHRYVVFAEDRAGNPSLPSNEVRIEISGDAPGIPTITQARSQLNAAALQLHWQAGGGAVPVRFRLFASALADDPAEPYREIARPASSPWLHEGLSYGMRLYYRIQAEDAAGNLSQLSPPFEARVRDLRTPLAPVITGPALAPARLQWTEARYRICGIAEPGRSIDVRVNDETRAQALARSAASVLTPVEIPALSVGDVALSPDGRRIAWIQGEGRVRERNLDTGEMRELPLWLAGALRYDAISQHLHGRHGSGQAWSVYSDRGGETRLDFGLERVERALPVGAQQGWIVAGVLRGEHGLWWVEAEGASPRRIANLQGEAVVDLVADPRASSVFVLTDSGRVLRWQAGAEPAQVVAIGASIQGLRAHPTEAAVLAWLSEAGRTRVWRLDADGARSVLDVSASATDVVPAADGTGIWLLRLPTLQRYAWNGNASIETLPLAGDQNFERLLPSRSGRFLVAALQERIAIQAVDSAGAWCSPEISSVAGLNRIVAVASNEAGVRGSPSVPLDLDIDAQIEARADLAVTAADVRLLPSPGIAGQPHSLLLEIRNPGLGDAWDFDVQVAVTDPQGVTTNALRRASLGAGARGLISLPLGLLQSGEYRVEAQLDSESRIDELSETNNATAVNLQISATAEPQLALTARVAEQPPGTAFEGRVSVAVASAFSGRVEMWVADTGGAQVARLPDIESVQLTPLSPWSRAWTWLPPEGLLAGGYRLHARLLDDQGRVRSEHAIDLSLQSRVELALSLQPAIVELPVGQSLAVAIGFDVPASNVLIEGGQLQLQLERADGSTATLWNGDTGAVSAGYRLRRTVNWATAGEAPGEIRLRLRFNAPRLSRELLRAVQLLPTATPPSLYGDLRPSPAATVALGQPAQLGYRIGNRGGAALSAQAVRVQVLGETAEAGVILNEQRSVDLASGQSMDFELDLAGLPQRPGQYAAVLEAETPQGWRRLAQLGLQTTDVEAPIGELLLPEADRPVRTPAYVEAAIRDRHSRVDFAEFSLNDGTWRALPGAGERYSSVLGALPDGEHRLALRAQDIWGNRWQMRPHLLTVDNTPPVIEIRGVVEAEHYAAPVRPTFVAQDAHLAEVRAWHNGIPVESGALIPSEGAHRLEVQAVDAAGNRTRRELSFVLDFTAPTLNFVDPAEGARISSPETRVEVATEPGARVDVSTAAWQGSAIADAQGRAVLPAVPLQVGSNRIDARASDRAGNRSVLKSVQVTRVQTGGELVGQVSVPAATHVRGEALQVQLVLLNETNAPVVGEAVLRLRSAAGLLLAELREPAQLQAGERMSWSESIDSRKWPLGALGVQLLFADGAGEVVLSSTGLEIVDRAPPQLRVLQPGNAGPFSSPLTVQVEAIDDDGLAEVAVRVVEGAWQPLAASGPPLFTAALPLADGAHLIEVRALDRSGNATVTSPISVVIDSTPPTIVIEGVAHEGLYGEPVQPQVRMLDAHPDTLVVTVNDQAFVPGSRLDRSGRYRLSVQARDRLGQSSERAIEFELDLEPVSLQLLSPTEGAILPSDRVDLIGQTKPRAQVSVQAPLSTHQVQADTLGQFRVAGVGLTPGANTLVLRAVDALGRPSADLVRTVRVDTTGQQGLTGQLSSAAEIAVDQPWTLQVELRESIGQSRQGIPARVLIERAGQVMHEMAWNATLPANGQESRELIPPVQGTLGALQLRLQTRLEGQWVEIARRDLAVVDRTAPALAFLAPAADSYHRSEIELRAQATDLHGTVATVQARIDGGEWTKLNPGSDASWAVRLQPLDEGRVTLELRAMDSAQNWTPILRRSVIHDRSAPELDITGVSEAGLYRQRVRIEVRAKDASPVDLQLQLNGAPFVNGQWVEGHGRHSLSARATDAAGNISTRLLEFEIDLLPPEVVIASPTAAAVIRSEETQILGRTEPNADVKLRVHEVERDVRADAQGQFRFDRVPLRIGANRLQVRATDRAGNVGLWSEVSVERRGGFTLRGDLQAPTELAVGASLRVSARVSNDAAHPQPDVQLRLLARDAAGRERVLDSRVQSLAAGEVIHYTLSVPTADWSAGATTLRLLATDEIEVQLADARVQMRGHTGLPPPLPKPRPIPIDQPLTLALLAWMLLLAAWAALRRQARQS